MLWVTERERGEEKDRQTSGLDRQTKTNKVNPPPFPSQEQVSINLDTQQSSQEWDNFAVSHRQGGREGWRE